MYERWSVGLVELIKCFSIHMKNTLKLLVGNISEPIMEFIEGFPTNQCVRFMMLEIGHGLFKQVQGKKT